MADFAPLAQQKFSAVPRAPSGCKASAVNVSPDEFVSSLLWSLSVRADPERAAWQQAYLKSQREFLGVSTPEARRVVKAAVADADVKRREDVMAVVEACWEQVLFDARSAAIEILTLCREVLMPSDLVVIEAMIVDAETWAILDGLATKVVGSIVERHPAETGPVLDRWAADPDSFWLRRASMLALLDQLRAGGGDWDRFCRYADGMLHEREFFIRKAIGWVLRETSKRRPDMVREWVEPRLDSMSGVTRREALKYL